MSTKARTVDNLGMDAYSRYARDQEILDTKFIEEANLVSSKTEISVSKPYIPTDFDLLFSLGHTASWAEFTPPPTANLFSKSLFSFQLIPSLGEREDITAAEFVEDALQKKKKNKKRSPKELQEEDEEKEVIINLLECIEKIDKALQLINARRNQYQRG